MSLAGYGDVGDDSGGDYGEFDGFRFDPTESESKISGKCLSFGHARLHSSLKHFINNNRTLCTNVIT